MKTNFAYETYKNVEAPRNYKTQQERVQYIERLKKRTDETEMPFLRKHLPRHLDAILEIGSGSGRILHALVQEGVADTAVGIEISPSRVAFGKRWARESGIKGVRHEVGDILRRAPAGNFDAALCMTSIFPFFDMLEKNGLEKMLRRAQNVLKPGGYLVLESVTFVHEIALCRAGGGSAQIWEEYAEGDPFRFNLVRYDWDEKKRHLSAVSYNVMRDRLFVDGPTIKKWHMETGAALKERLKKAGFSRMQLFGDFDSSAYVEGKSPRCIMLARL